MEVELLIPEAASLKDKRRVVKSLKARLMNRFNISVAEVDALDSHKRAVLGMAMVANERRFVESCLDKVVDFVRMNRHATLIDYHTDIWS